MYGIVIKGANDLLCIDIDESEEYGVGYALTSANKYHCIPFLTESLEVATKIANRKYSRFIPDSFENLSILIDADKILEVVEVEHIIKRM